jgi:hypothetical protein
LIAFQEIESQAVLVSFVLLWLVSPASREAGLESTGLPPVSIVRYSKGPVERSMKLLRKEDILN